MPTGNQTTKIPVSLLILVVLFLMSGTAFGQFTQHYGYNTGENGACIWGDYDNDQDLDFLSLGYPGLTGLFTNNDGAFSVSEIGLPGLCWSSAAWGDYDNDGDLDILICGDTGEENITRIYQNDSGSFTDIAAGLEGMYNGFASWGDYDADGDLLTAAGIDAVVTVLMNNGNATFAAPVTYAGGAGTYAALAADVDGDGHLDQSTVMSIQTRFPSVSMPAMARSVPGLTTRPGLFPIPW